jgi:hypothetical protein
MYFGDRFEGQTKLKTVTTADLGKHPASIALKAQALPGTWTLITAP